MKLLARWLGSFTVFMLASFPAQAVPALEPVFTVTHLCPSPMTIQSGRFSYGSELTLGVTDFLQIGTNIVRDFYQVFNANAKISLLNFETFAFALTFQAQTYNTRALDPSAASVQVTSYQPGAVAAIGLIPNRLAWFVSGQWSFSQVADTSTASSGYLVGTSLNSDISWQYMLARKTRSGAVVGGQAVSAGVSYDFSYAQFGIGISHHWPGFHIGFHYYPNGGSQKFLPILTGGGSFQL